jgi:hypothetical protein
MSINLVELINLRKIKKCVTLFDINRFCDTYIDVFGGAIEPALNIAGPHRK